MQNQDQDFAGENIMNEIIEADFFPPAVEIIKDTSHALLVDNDPDAAQPVEPQNPSASPVAPRGFLRLDGEPGRA
jgi:hypothetical protein